MDFGKEDNICSELCHEYLTVKWLHVLWHKKHGPRFFSAHFQVVSPWVPNSQENCVDYMENRRFEPLDLHSCYVCSFQCIYIYAYVYVHLYMYICVYVYMYIIEYDCICVYIYIYSMYISSLVVSHFIRSKCWKPHKHPKTAAFQLQSEPGASRCLDPLSPALLGPKNGGS